ncbi:hypothetical protein CSW57_17770 [Williamsia muralis]|uniref:Uncharacterized protein n=1 Tax=Williamsia marianensis TaxID=85044 RepID=A0A2G3PKG1_WILMA|nr:hypothetical protein CSW57_17770 [Williamsia marianensis]
MLHCNQIQFGNAKLRRKILGKLHLTSTPSNQSLDSSYACNTQIEKTFFVRELTCAILKTSGTQETPFHALFSISLKPECILARFRKSFVYVINIVD